MSNGNTWLWMIKIMTILLRNCVTEEHTKLKLIGINISRCLPLRANQHAGWFRSHGTALGP